MDPNLYTCWPYPMLEGRCLGAFVAWLISTATAALMLLTVSSMPTMVSMAQTDPGLGQHAHVCDAKACLAPYPGEGGALIMCERRALAGGAVTSTTCTFVS